MEKDTPAKLGHKRTGSLTHKDRKGEYAIHDLAVDLLRLSTVEWGSGEEEEGGNTEEINATLRLEMGTGTHICCLKAI